MPELLDLLREIADRLDALDEARREDTRAIREQLDTIDECRRREFELVIKELDILMKGFHAMIDSSIAFQKALGVALAERGVIGTQPDFAGPRAVP